MTITEIMSLAGLASSVFEEAKTAKVSKSTLMEIARAAGDEAAQLRLWSGVAAGATSVRALRAKKKAPDGQKLKASPVSTAARIGESFAAALTSIPPGEGGNLAEVILLVQRSLSLLKILAVSLISIIEPSADKLHKLCEH